MLSVQGVKIYDLCLVNPPPSPWKSDPKFKIKIKYGNETRSTPDSEAKKGDTDGDSRVIWNESFTFPGDIMDDSQVTFTAIRQAQFIPITMGSPKRLVTNLLKIQNDSGLCKLDVTGNCYLTFRIERSSGIVPELVAEASAALTHLPNLQVPANFANLFTSADQFYNDQEEAWSLFLLQFKEFMKAMDKVSEINAYVQLAWSILSVIPKTIITQRNRNDKVKQLCGNMMDIYDYVTDAKRLPELTTTQLKTLSVLVQQTIECAYFIRAYSAENTVKRVLKGASMDDKIQRFNDKFDHLKQVMTDSVNLERNIITLRVSEGISEQNDLTLLNEMPYDSDAGFISKKRCSPGTRQTLIGEILKWVNNETSPQILVLTGQAGVGKSAVAHTIAGRFREQNRLGSMFCFNRIYKDRQNYLFSTMARNLADGDDMWRKELGKAIKNTADRKSKDPRIQFEEFIFGPSQNVTTIGPIVIVVDALDESGDRAERQEILELLFNKCSKLPKNYRIILTSRPEQDIELHCQNTRILCIRMGNINSEETHSDIRTYVSEFLYPISSILDRIDGDWREILAKRAEGLFQWARTACVYIDPNIKRSQLIEKKWTTCISDSSSSLYGLYHQIISGQSESQDADFIEDFKTVVGAIIMAREPLSIDALQNIFPNTGDIRSILSPFGSLFAGVHDSSTPVRPLHTSLFDFFTATTENRSYYVDTSDHSTMTISCLQLMKKMLRFNICQLETSHKLNQDVPQFDSRVREAVPQHLNYSCRFWAFHLRSSPRGEKLVREIRYFMDHNLLYWFEVLSLLGAVAVDQCCVEMRILKNWCTDVDKDLAADATDACDFGYDFEQVMTDSTPHLYLSALPFTPRNSFVSKTYLAAYRGLLAFDIGPPLLSSPRIGVMRRIHGRPGSLAFNPKGKYIATGSTRGEFLVWDYKSGEVVHAYNHSRGATIRDIVFSSDGELVYCCFGSRDILVLNIRTNETHIEPYGAAMPMMGDQDWCRSFTISSDGCFLALCMEKGAFLYDRKNRLIIKHFDRIRRPVFSPNGELFTFNSMNGKIYIWNLSKQAPGTSPPEQAFKVLFSPVALSDIYTAFVGYSGLLEIWDVRTSTKVTKIRHKSPHVDCIVFSPDNQYLLSSSSHMYFIWDVSTGKSIIESTVDHAIECLAFSYDSKSIALGTKDGSTNVRQWDTSIQPSTGSHADTVDDRLVLEIVLSDPYLIIVYQFPSKKCLQISDITTPNIVRFEAELTYQPLITVCSDEEPDVHVAYVTGRRLCLWDKTKGEITVDESAHAVTALASSSKYLVSADTNGSRSEGIIKMWDINTRDLVGGPYIVSGQVVCFCVSATSINFIAAYRCVDGYYQFEIRQCDSGRIIGGPFKLESCPRTVAFSPDETRIICIHQESAEIIGVSTGKVEKWMLRRMSSLSPNGKYLAGIDDDDDRVGLLDTDTGMTLHISSLGRPASICVLGHSNDSKQTVIIFHVNDPGTAWVSEVSVWDTQSGTMIFKLPFGFQSILISDLSLSNGYLVVPTYYSTPVLDMNAFEIISTLYDTHRNDQQLVDIDLKGGWWSTTMSKRTEVLDYALMAWKKASLPASAMPNVKGWVLGLKKELLLWIPQNRRAGFWPPCAVHVPYRDVTKLNFNNFVHGTKWTECRNESNI